MKKPLTILSLLALVCTGCIYMGSATKEVSASSENVTDAEESTATKEEPSKEDEADIAVETDTGQYGVGKMIAEDKSIPTKEITAEESEVIASEEPPKEEGKADIAVGADTEKYSVEETVIESVTTKETTESVETAITTEENKLCVGLAKEIYEETNKERVAAGMPELEWSDELAQAADIRAEEIINCFSHVRPDGTKCYALGDRIHGENIAKGPHATGVEFLEHWMASSGHKENILRKEFTMIGVGTRCTEMGDTAVQIFGY